MGKPVVVGLGFCEFPTCSYGILSNQETRYNTMYLWYAYGTHMGDEGLGRVRVTSPLCLPRRLPHLVSTLGCTLQFPLIFLFMYVWVEEGLEEVWD